MFYKKEKEDNSKKRINVKLKDQLNSDSIRQEKSEKVSDDSRNMRNQNLFCTNNPINIKLPIGIHNKVFINPNLGNFCETTSTDISENEITILSESVGLKNVDEKSDIKESQTFMTHITDDLLEYKILEIFMPN